MRKLHILSAAVGAAFLLSACHNLHHHHRHPPGHGGIPPGQAKKGGWHSPPGHKRLDQRSRTDNAPLFY